MSKSRLNQEQLEYIVYFEKIVAPFWASTAFLFYAIALYTQPMFAVLQLFLELELPALLNVRLDFEALNSKGIHVEAMMCLVALFGLYTTFPAAIYLYGCLASPITSIMVSMSYPMAIARFYSNLYIFSEAMMHLARGLDSAIYILETVEMPKIWPASQDDMAMPQKDEPTLIQSTLRTLGIA